MFCLHDQKKKKIFSVFEPFLSLNDRNGSLCLLERYMNFLFVLFIQYTTV